MRSADEILLFKGTEGGVHPIFAFHLFTPDGISSTLIHYLIHACEVAVDIGQEEGVRTGLVLRDICVQLSSVFRCHGVTFVHAKRNVLCLSAR